MVRIKIAYKFVCMDEAAASNVLQTMQNQGLELAGFQPIDFTAGWIQDGTRVIAWGVNLEGEFSPVPFMELFRLVSLWAITLEVNYAGVVSLSDGEYDIQGEGTFIDNSWVHDQCSGCYANSENMDSFAGEGDE